MLDNPQIIIPAFASQSPRERIGWKRVWLHYGDNIHPRWVYKKANGNIAQVASEILEELDVQNKLIRSCNDKHETEIPLMSVLNIDPDSDSEIETEAEIPVVIGGPYAFSSIQPTRYLVWDFEFETWTVSPFHTTTSFVHRKYLGRIYSGLSSITTEQIKQTRDYHAYMKQLLPRLASSQFTNTDRKRPRVASFCD